MVLYPIQYKATPGRTTDVRSSLYKVARPLAPFSFEEEGDPFRYKAIYGYCLDNNVSR